MENETAKERRNAKQEPVIYCKYCGAQLHRRRYGNRLEDLGAFKRRKYCNRECMRRGYLKVGENEQTYSNAHTTARELNNLILHKRECEICGSTSNLDIHHKDENWKNNSPENLQCLCRSCHMKVHRPREACKICGEPTNRHGYCNKHLLRLKKYGNPYMVRGKDERNNE